MVRGLDDVPLGRHVVCDRADVRPGVAVVQRQGAIEPRYVESSRPRVLDWQGFVCEEAQQQGLVHRPEPDDHRALPDPHPCKSCKNTRPLDDVEHASALFHRQ